MNLKELKTHCLLCKRQLRSTESVLRGYGPVCAKKAKNQEHALSLLAFTNEPPEQNWVDELKEKKVGSA